MLTALILITVAALVWVVGQLRARSVIDTYTDAELEVLEAIERVYEVRHRAREQMYRAAGAPVPTSIPNTVR